MNDAQEHFSNSKFKYNHTINVICVRNGYVIADNITGSNACATQYLTND